MEEVEPPECPVCLQPYDAVSAIPRVLSCGHTTCEACLKQLPNPFPNALRCTVCTLLVKFSNSPSSFPKNLDLLHISSALQHRPTKGKQEISSSSLAIRAKTENKSPVLPLIPKPWSYEFYCKWKKWFIPEDRIMIEKMGGLGNDCGVFCGEILRSFESDFVVGGVVREKEMVGLVKVGIFMVDVNSSKFFELSYESKILSVLYGIKENEKTELDFILTSSFRCCNLGKVFGIWYHENGRGVYIVFEKFNSPNLVKNVFRKEDEEERLSIEDMSGFGMLCMEMCEILSFLHFQGVVLGCLHVNCLGFNKFGRVYVDFSEVLNIGRRLNLALLSGHKDLEISLNDTLLGENLVFISPEVLLQFLEKKGFELGCRRSRYEVTSASDVWSLASLLVWLIVGSSFPKEMNTCLLSFVSAITDEKGCDYSGLYMIWMEKSVALLGRRLGTEFVDLNKSLSRCLQFDPGNRPAITELWQCLRELVSKPQYDTGINLEPEVKKEDLGHCLVLGDLCQIVEEMNKKSIDVCGDYERANADEDAGTIGDVGEGLSRGHIKCIEMKGHLDCVTGLAVGGGLLFSSSYDKMVCVWSLQDFAHVHYFKGHEHRVMAVVFVDGEQPLCISGDSEGVICLWDANFPFNEVPIKKLYEQKDWRYSGVHALAVSGTEFLYTGSGDKLIKVWSLQDYTLLCSLSGHTSVVSSLAVCNGVLYSGSWDGTVRLWSLGDHSPLAVLGENKLRNMACVTSFSAENHLLFVGYENGYIKIWHNDVMLKSTQTHNGSVLAVCKKEKWLFCGGWDKKISLQEISEDGDGTNSIDTGVITCDSVITALIYWEGKLFAGLSDGTIKAYHGVKGLDQKTTQKGTQ